jgi:hypothetical protein
VSSDDWTDQSTNMALEAPGHGGGSHRAQQVNKLQTRAQQRCRDCRPSSAGWFSQTPHGQNGASPPIC